MPDRVALAEALLDQREVVAAQVQATLALVEETARLGDAQETANMLAAIQVEGLLSLNERESLKGQIGAALYGVGESRG